MNLEEEFDQRRLGPFHRRLITVAGLGTLFDSMDVGILSFVMAALISAWHLNPVQIGIMGSINLVGMAIGAAVAGFLADRIGRRRIFMATLLIYSLATGLSGFSLTLGMLFLLRFIVGLGLGGELPVTTTLVAEFLPSRDRGRGIVLLESFWAVGWLVASLIAYLLIPRWGWRVAFFVGAIPALYVLYLRRGIPESPRFLLHSGRPEEARRVMQMVTGEEMAASLTTSRKLPRSRRIRELFGSSLRTRTVMAWVLWIGMNFSYYGMFLWLPSVLVERGYTLIHSFEYTVLVTVFQIPGYFSAAWLIDRWGRKPILVCYLLLTAVSATLFGFAQSVTMVLLAGAALSFFMLGAFGVTYAYTSEQYPTAIRGTGSGWAMGIGRIGGIVGPFIVGLLLAGHQPIIYVFMLFTLALLIVAALVGILGRETRHLSMRSIDQEV